MENKNSLPRARHHNRTGEKIKIPAVAKWPASPRISGTSRGTSTSRHVSPGYRVLVPRQGSPILLSHVCCKLQRDTLKNHESRADRPPDTATLKFPPRKSRRRCPPRPRWMKLSCLLYSGFARREIRNVCERVCWKHDGDASAMMKFSLERRVLINGVVLSEHLLHGGSHGRWNHACQRVFTHVRLINAI